ncbi:MAG TPA: hypothetical protein PK950_02100 [Candidatus Paceibacterota bacterium]|nr:hypothetical protein [Candidatus Paceibacterota bacterium]
MKTFKNYITPALALIPSTAFILFLIKAIAAGQISFPAESLLHGNFVNVLILLVMTISFVWMFVASLISIFSKAEPVYRRKNKTIVFLFIPVVLVIAIWAVVHFYADAVYVGDPVTSHSVGECPAGFSEC